MNQLFGSCVNALTTDYEIRRNGPSPVLYFSLLLDPTPAYPGPTIVGGRAGGLDHPTHPHARPRWSAQGTRAVGRSVGQSVVSNFPAIQVRRFIHLGDAHSKQWAALNAFVSIPR